MSFAGPAGAYDDYMGRYSRPLAPQFARFSGVVAGRQVVDVGCGPGALTQVLADLVGAPLVAAAEPSPGYAAACAARLPDVDVRRAGAEDLPWPDGSFDAALAQLVVHFMADPVAGVREMGRVVRPGGVVAGCTWDTGGAMTMHRVFWAAAAALRPAAGATDPAGRRYGTPDELRAVWERAGLTDVLVAPLDVAASYDGFDDFWLPFTSGTGPAGAYCVALPPAEQAELREGCRRLLGAPAGSFRLPARSWAVRGQVSARRGAPDGPATG